MFEDVTSAGSAVAGLPAPDTKVMMPSRPPSTLLLFTQSYPFDVAIEGTFLDPELPYLREAFDRVIVIPATCEGSRTRPPDGIEVDESLARYLSSHANRLGLVMRASVSRIARSDLTERPALLTRRTTMSRLAITAGKAELTRVWVERMLAREGLRTSSCVAYTFWCEATTAGLGLVKRDRPDVVVVSRAHGADLYADRYAPPYLPGRRFTLQQLDRLLPDSDRGVEYVTKRYPWFARRCEVARLGVADPGFLARPSDSGHFVLASCSRMVPIKRLDLILRTLDLAARGSPDIQFEWHHFGDGPLRASLEAQALDLLGANAAARFHGYPSRDGLFEFYRTHPVDVFLNTSLSEGTPVAVMEAISCGIPVIATAVGGNPEIVSAQDGSLVDPNAEPSAIAAEVMAMIERPELTLAKRIGSRRVWGDKYDAARNYADFAHLLVDLRAAS